MIELATIGAILLTLFVWYIAISRQFYDKPVLAFSLYLLLLITLPNSIGFHYKIDLRLWQFIALIFLVPYAFNLFLRGKIRFDPIDMAVILLVLLGSITTFIWMGIQSGLGTIYKGILYTFLPYLGGRYFIKTEEDFFKIMKVLTWCAIIVSLIALIEFYIGKGYLEVMPFNVELKGWGESLIDYRFGQKRVAASFGHPIYLGTYLFLITTANIILLLHRNVYFQHIKVRYIICQIALSGVVLLISQARTVAVSFTCVLIIYLTLNYFKISKIKLIKYGITLTIIVLPVFFLYFYDYFIEFLYHNVISSKATDNWDGRILALNEGIRILRNYSNWFGETNRVFYGKWAFENTELSNGFINSLSLKGMFWFLVYIFVWCKAFISSYFLKKNQGLPGIILLYIFLYLFITNNITELNFQNNILFYVFVGLAVCPALHFQYKYPAKSNQVT